MKIRDSTVYFIFGEIKEFRETSKSFGFLIKSFIKTPKIKDSTVYARFGGIKEFMETLKLMVS